MCFTNNTFGTWYQRFGYICRCHKILCCLREAWSICSWNLIALTHITGLSLQYRKQSISYYLYCDFRGACLVEASINIFEGLLICCSIFLTGKSPKNAQTRGNEKHTKTFSGEVKKTGKNCVYLYDLEDLSARLPVFDYFNLSRLNAALSQCFGHSNLLAPIIGKVIKQVQFTAAYGDSGLYIV